LPYFSPLGNEDLPISGSKERRDRLMGRGGHFYSKNGFKDPNKGVSAPATPA